MAEQAYTKSADVYDVIYQWVDYPGDAATILAAVRQRRPGACSLLEIGCGTGPYVAEFAREMEVVGVDLSAEMLAVAERRLPGVEFIQADMRSLDLGRTFDVVACLFSSIGYMTTPADLRLALERMVAHLDPGGVLIVDPWFDPDTYIPGHVSADIYRGDGIVVTRTSYGAVEDGVSVLDMDHVVLQENIGRAHFVERHRMGLFTADEYRKILDDLGIEAERYDVPWDGRYRWIGSST